MLTLECAGCNKNNGSRMCIWKEYIRFVKELLVKGENIVIGDYTIQEVPREFLANWGLKLNNGQQPIQQK